MANYVCQLIKPKISSTFIGSVKISSDNIHAGQVFVADELDTSSAENFSVYKFKTITDNDLKNYNIAILLNDNFETLTDGRRPSGKNNYYGITYNQNQNCSFAFIDNKSPIIISMDSINQNTINLAVVGNYLIPVSGSTYLSAVTTIPNTTAVAYKIVKYYNTPVLEGLSKFALSLLCIPVIRNIDTGNLIFDYNIPNQIGITEIDHENGTIDLAYKGDKTNLIATFSNSVDATVKVGNTTQVSGVTANDFTNSVNYVVTPESGNSRTYTVTVTSVYTLTITTDDNSIAQITNEYGEELVNNDNIFENEFIKINGIGKNGYDKVEIEVNGEEFTPDTLLQVEEDCAVEIIGVKSTFSVDTTEVENLTFNSNQTPTYFDEYTGTLQASTGYMLPETINVFVNNIELLINQQYTYNATTGIITIIGSNVTGNIKIVASGIAE